MAFLQETFRLGPFKRVKISHGNQIGVQRTFLIKAKSKDAKTPQTAASSKARLLHAWIYSHFHILMPALNKNTPN